MKTLTFTPEYAPDAQVLSYFHVEIEDHKYLRPAVIICPGGGYGFLSEREATPVSKRYWAAGYQTFVLKYPIDQNAANFKPLLALAATVAELRRNAAQWGIDPNKIAVCGFSAGGHLAASLGTLFNDEKFLAACQIPGKLRPDAMILGYPVITSDEDTHQGTLELVSGAQPGAADYQYFGLENHVDEETPTAFIWTTATDQLVPATNSLKLATAMSKAGVPFEMHIFPYGVHGMSVCTNEIGGLDPYLGRWMDWSILWLNRIFDFAC